LDLFLSIIVPALNEGLRLPKALPLILDFLHQQSYPSEILVVDNGSTDQTALVVQEFAAKDPLVRLIRVDRRGKGLAVRLGMQAASGAYRFFCDADLSMPVDQIPRFLPPQLSDFEIAIASREAPGAVRIGEPAFRHWIGRGFNLLVRAVAIPHLHDTQCGFKCFQADAAIDLFSVQRLDGWTFDVETLFIAQHRGYRIVELPIPWHYRPGSRVKPLRDSLLMLADLFRIRDNWRQGLYAPSQHA
jgi:dolichyl-phosphate beta-glucosyltransferase